MMVSLTFLKQFIYIFKEKSELPEVLFTISFPQQHVVRVQYVLFLSLLYIPLNFGIYLLVMGPNYGDLIIGN